MSINKAITTAHHSTFRFKLGAVITKNGRVIEAAYNKIGHNKNNLYPTIHAEENVIHKVLRKEKGLSQLAGATLYIARIRSNHTTGLARPCNHCMQLLHSVGIKRIIYTTNSSINTEDL